MTSPASTPDHAAVELVVLALAGDMATSSDYDRADSKPGEWCAECIGRRPAAINAARLAVAALAEAGLLLSADAPTRAEVTR